MITEERTTVSAGILNAFDLPREDCDELLRERVEDISDWYQRVREQKNEYKLPDITIKRLMQCVRDLIDIAKYYQKLEKKDEPDS